MMSINLKGLGMLQGTNRKAAPSFINSEGAMEGVHMDNDLVWKQLEKQVAGGKSRRQEMTRTRGRCVDDEDKGSTIASSRQHNSPGTAGP
jgi:hypothetical protein